MPEYSRIFRFCVALCVGSIIGLAIGLLIRGYLIDESIPIRPGIEPWPPREASVAWKYARAMQEGDWEWAVRHTLWMRDRLRYVELHEGGTEAREKQELVLFEQLGQRTVEGNQLLKEGIEDQYVFKPGAALMMVGSDTPGEMLDRPVAERVWIRVTYPGREFALRDELHLPIRALTVGVNVSHDGYVLKANIIGNLDIDHDSISYNWDEIPGG